MNEQLSPTTAVTTRNHRQPAVWPIDILKGMLMGDYADNLGAAGYLTQGILGSSHHRDLLRGPRLAGEPRQRRSRRGDRQRHRAVARAGRRPDDPCAPQRPRAPQHQGSRPDALALPPLLGVRRWRSSRPSGSSAACGHAGRCQPGGGRCRRDLLPQPLGNGAEPARAAERPFPTSEGLDLIEPIESICWAMSRLDADGAREDPWETT